MSFADYKRQTEQRRRLILGAVAGVGLLGMSAYGLYALFGDEPYQGKTIPLLPGTNYLQLGAPGRPIAPAGKIEVLSFFNYGCAACFRLEPVIASWRRTLPSNVSFHRFPAITDEVSQLHSRMFFAADKMGISEELHPIFFEAIHLKSNPLNVKERVLDLVSKRGYSRTAFSELMDGSYGSEMFALQSSLLRHFRVQSVPSMGVKSIYYTDSSLAGGGNQLLDLTSRLVSL